MAKERAFSLVELLNVVAIIAILSAILMPAAVSVRAMAYQYSAVHSLGELGKAAAMYASDSDETYMPAFYGSSSGMQFWFGTRSPSRAVDPANGLLRPYTGHKTLADPTYKAETYLGDMSGFGYNWAFLGSDFGLTGNFQSFPDCINPANVSALSNPSKTLVMATSSYYFASWLPKGDRKTYDFGFIDPPAWWRGNPDMDFRFMGFRTEESDIRVVASKGNAPVVYADGHSGTLKQTQVLNENFIR
jgi:prepilin-type N-terminal cleavage/methylation domain-containing protein